MPSASDARHEHDRSPRPAKPGKVVRRAAFTCVALVLLYFVVPVDLSDTTTTFIIRTVVSLAVFAGLLVAINRHLLRQLDQPDAPLGGLFAGIVGGVLFFALLDYVIAIHQPGQFSGLQTRIDALYFALATLATIGYGDVHAQGQLGRGVVILQMVFDVAVLATAASVLGRQIGARLRSRRQR
jgi:voltage-gated potassium channel